MEGNNDNSSLLENLCEKTVNKSRYVCVVGNVEGLSMRSSWHTWRGTTRSHGSRAATRTATTAVGSCDWTPAGCHLRASKQALFVHTQCLWH